MYILVDCNQFFVSCEKVFQPKLEGKPVVVLSNNDGCVISRSQEAKALGIPMGAPFFKIEDLLKLNHVHVFSSNFGLYGDLSERVMQTLSSFCEEMEIYSIDEAFLWKENADLKFCQQVRSRIKKWTGIPVSLGVGPTKTLAKAANELAKKQPDGIYFLSALDQRLKTFAVEDVWGIGRHKTEALHKKGIYTAEQLALSNEELIRKLLSVTGVRTALELRGIKCLDTVNEHDPKQGIVHSRSFGKPVFSLEELDEAVADYAAKVAEKMRSQGSAAAYLQVSLIANRFDPSFSHYTKSGFTLFEEAVSYTPILIEEAKKLLRSLYHEQIPYKKTAVHLGGLVPAHGKALDLFSDCSKEEMEKQERLMDLLDRLNKKKNRVFYLAEGIEKPWKMKKNRSSPSYTTSWEDLPKVKAE